MLLTSPTSERCSAPAAAAPVVNMMTVDVEDYFQVSGFENIVPRERWGQCESRVERNTERLLTLFEAARVRATFFVLGWVAERFPGLVRQIAASGHEIASHGYGHRLVYGMSRASFREDIRQAKWLLESCTGQAVLGYRAPSFSITAQSLWALDVLIEEGYGYDASIYPIHHDRYGIPDAPRHSWQAARPAGSIWEVPGSTVRIGGTNLPIGGGGYFRLLPYGWIHAGISRVNRVERRPVVFYVHPWEIDPDQPRLPGSAFTRLRHYRNLHKTERRLTRLLRDFSFATISSVVLPTPVPSAFSPVSQVV